MANLVDLARSYAKQETNPETLTRAKLAPHHTPEEHKLDDEEFTNKQICTICQLGASSAPSGPRATGGSSSTLRGSPPREGGPPRVCPTPPG